MSGHAFKGPSAPAPKPTLRRLSIADRDEQQATLDAACRALAKGREYQTRQMRDGGGWDVIAMKGEVIYGTVRITATSKHMTIDWTQK